MQNPKVHARPKKKAGSVAGLLAGTVRPGCVKQSKPWPGKNKHGGGTLVSPQLSPPIFRQASTLCFVWAWSPLYICMTGRPVPRQSGHLQESSFPLWIPGLVMPRPCHTDCAFRSGGETQKEAQMLKKADTFFYKCNKLMNGCSLEDTDLGLWMQRR